MRTLEEITKEYADLCARGGHLDYQKHVIKEEIAFIYKKLRELNEEAQKLKEGESSHE